jgi:hypothetical protein
MTPLGDHPLDIDDEHTLDCNHARAIRVAVK